MNYLGISYDYRNKPLLDPSFIPFGVWAKAFLDGAERPFKVALERDGGHVSVFSSFLRGEEYAEANLRYMERYVKFLLWPRRRRSSRTSTATGASGTSIITSSTIFLKRTLSW